MRMKTEPKDKEAYKFFVERMKYALQKMETEINIRENNNAGFVSQVIVNNLANQWINLADVEVMLREQSSRVFLLALPVEVYGDGFETFFPGRPQNDTGYYPYALWVCMNGRAEAEKTMMEHGLNSVDNQVRLHSCGFLTLKQNNK
jgi:hypothetical protein